jgi:hypothetical protein
MDGVEWVTARAGSIFERLEDIDPSTVEQSFGERRRKCFQIGL